MWANNPHGSGVTRYLGRVIHSWFRSLAYPGKGGRDLRIDFLRGYCLFVMMVDHLGAKSFFFNLTGNIQFYTSAAEGFYFISGLTLGLLAARESFTQSVERLLLRSMVLYRTAILIALGFGTWSLLTGLKVWDTPWPRANWLEPVLPILTMRQGYAGSEIDQGITLGGKANIVVTDNNGVAFGRSTTEVLAIVYLGSTGKGGFFPNGLNGNIK